ncbi:MAG TPA: helix-turn-helix transcriptional regulator [Rectinemataceae bacterium]|nr:helix-turn-helix transcriptional regulator [Rectinemataceae bacterium]
MSLREALAINLKMRRRLLGLSQAELAERAEISPGYVGEIEIARKFPTPEVLQSLAASLEVPAYRLIMTSEDVNTESGQASRRQAYEVAVRLRDRLDEEIKELATPFDAKELPGEDPPTEPA